MGWGCICLSDQQVSWQDSFSQTGRIDRIIPAEHSLIVSMCVAYFSITVLQVGTAELKLQDKENLIFFEEIF